MKYVSTAVLLLQLAAFAGATIWLLKMLAIVVSTGGFFPHLGRLLAVLAPYLLLPVSIIVSFVLWVRKSYVAATWLPCALLVGAAIAGQLYLAVVPDPIQDNFGPRSEPYAGFLVLPSEAVPAGFQEHSHHYTKQEYSISFRKAVNDRWIGLGVSESPTTQFMFNSSSLVREFEHQGITGRIYTYYNSKTGTSSLDLVWLNPPRQRILIDLTQRPGDPYSPDDLIDILKSMRPVSGRP